MRGASCSESGFARALAIAILSLNQYATPFMSRAITRKTDAIWIPPIA